MIRGLVVGGGVLAATFIWAVPPMANQLWAKLSFLNPFFYMIDSFRYRFFEQSDFNPWVSLTIVGAAAFLFCGIAAWLFQRGFKIRS